MTILAEPQARPARIPPETVYLTIEACELCVHPSTTLYETNCILCFMEKYRRVPTESEVGL